MMHRVELISAGESLHIEAEGNSPLLDLLRNKGVNLYAPCGGKGSCGKCRVEVIGEGRVLACQYIIRDNISVIIPDKPEMDVLVSQHENSLVLPFIPDSTAMLASYPLGLAIDIGTTTLAFYQLNLITGVLEGIRSAVNTQSAFGADVISRISFATERSDGLKLLQACLTDQINEQLKIFGELRGVATENFTKIVIAGNNTMLHMLCATDPAPLAQAPFTPGFTDHRVLDPGELGLECHPQAEVHLLPSISAYVGADIVAGLASLKDQGDEPFLFLDIGTNGEMALVDKHRIIACATAAGPAFEGANISCGSGAVSGAISAYSSNRIQSIGHERPRSICGSGLVDIVACMLRAGKLSPEGIIEESFIVSPANDNAVDEDILITQQDIRELQLAKGAIAAGISILIKRSGYSTGSISKLYVAGGFGNYLNMENAVQIGLIPRAMKDRIRLVGNAAGAGALMALKSSAFFDRAEQVRKSCEYIELSYDQDFPLEFALQMNF